MHRITSNYNITLLYTAAHHIVTQHHITTSLHNITSQQITTWQHHITTSHPIITTQQHTISSQHSVHSISLLRIFLSASFHVNFFFEAVFLFHTRLSRLEPDANWHKTNRVRTFLSDREDEEKNWTVPFSSSNLNCTYQKATSLSYK